MVWNIDPDFEGNYVTDYQILQNEFTNGRTSWTDKYTTAIYSPSPNITTSRNQLQPLPDYIRWLKACELHYLPYGERVLLQHRPWDEVPGIFLPTRVLDLCYSLTDNPPRDVMTCVALLGWVTIQEATEYYRKIKR